MTLRGLNQYPRCKTHSTSLKTFTGKFNGIKLDEGK
jgi:hypothetical protein